MEVKICQILGTGKFIKIKMEQECDKRDIITIDAREYGIDVVVKQLNNVFYENVVKNDFKLELRCGHKVKDIDERFGYAFLSDKIFKKNK